ncbi:hypothetical protein CASFOL_023421 [Castilleja foliolosa]|uniref:Gnk2-homologous domain-containing protein n=1 Tax=Castilleja foliolosa TaxID=1961234 RepID=A0ABD3CPD1_9LAMI
MTYNSYLISILMITFYLLIPIAFSISDTELGHKCVPNNKTYTNIYNENRASVSINVIANTASNQGFRKAWINNTKNDPAYGLAMCRFDVSDDECTKCVSNAAQTLINTHCPNSRSAIIWHDFCFFKYSDVDFFGIIDTENMFILSGDSSPMSREFANATRNLTDSLQKSAIEGSTLYAYGESVLKDDTYIVYAIAQCTRDLSKANCLSCLEGITSRLENLFVTYQGVRVVCGSCNVRYETNSFLTS